MRNNSSVRFRLFPNPYSNFHTPPTVHFFDKEKKQLAFNDLCIQLTECEKLCKLMETEAVGSKQLQHKVRTYRRQYENNNKASFRLQEEYAVDKSKEKLFGAEIDNMKLSKGQTIIDGNNSLKESLRVMHDTEDISLGVGVQLQSHTNRLIANKTKLEQVYGSLNKGQKLIKTMMMRIRKNKFICFSVLGGIFLVAIIILGVHFSK